MIRLSLLFTAITLSSHLYGQTCPTGSPSTIYFANGVNNTHQEAMTSAYNLQQTVLAQSSNSNPLSPSCINFKLAWDQEFLEGNGSYVTFASTLSQLAIAGYQVGQQFLSQLWLSLASFVSLPAYVQQSFANDIVNPLSVVQPDVQTQVSDYAGDLTAGNKVVVVAHSQGNLYANQAWSALGSPGDSTFSVVPVASPANFVPNQDSWLTLDDDIILNVIGALPANSNNNPPPGAPCSSTSISGPAGQLACHSFVDSYLAGLNSRTQMMQNVISALPVYLRVSKLGTATGSISSSPAGITCDSPCTSSEAAFPNQTRVTLTANGGSSVSWGGDCAALADGGVTNAPSITFPVFYDVSGTVITSFPEYCTANLGPSIAVRLNPFGNQTGTVPYSVQAVDSSLVGTAAPGNITVTMLREVFSECSGLLFSSNRMVTIPQGQSSANFNFDAGHDPNCNTLPITTVYTVTGATLAPSTVLNLSNVPSQQLMLFSNH